MIRPAAFALLVVAVTLPATARDFYIDNVLGDDRNSGGVPKSSGGRVGPMASIGLALKAAEAGDTIIVTDTGVPYRECITLQGARHGAKGPSPFRLIGNGALLDGTVAVDSEAWRHDTGEVFSFQPHLLGHQVLYSGGRPLTQVVIDDVAEIADLEPLQWSYRRGRIYFRAEKNRLPQSYDLSYAGHAAGITLYDVEGVIIEGLTVQGFQLDGVHAADNVFDVSIASSILRGNGRSGVHVGGSCRVMLDACLVGSNSKAQVHASGYCHVRVRNCDVLDTDPGAPAFRMLDKSHLESVESPATDDR